MKLAEVLGPLSPIRGIGRIMRSIENNVSEGGNE
jgi:hypothetical protein